VEISQIVTIVKMQQYSDFLSDSDCRPCIVMSYGGSAVYEMKKLTFQRRIVAQALLGLLLSLPAAAAEIVFIAPLNHAMPLARFADGQLQGGILKELGDAMAQRMGRTARYLPVPSKRVSQVLERGEADCLCYALPRWLDGEFDWSRPVLQDAGVVMARREAPHLRGLGGLAGKRVGTVSGYRYPQLDAALGPDFVRDDGPTAEHSLRKLLAGRSEYAIVEQLMADYQLRNDPEHRLRIDLLVNRFQPQCAFSQRSKLEHGQMKRALDSLIDDGSIDKILAHYR